MSQFRRSHPPVMWRYPGDWDLQGEWDDWLATHNGTDNQNQPECRDKRLLIADRELAERAQSTVEYAMLLLGAAAVAMLVVAWVSRSDVIGRLFDTVFGRIMSQV